MTKNLLDCQNLPCPEPVLYTKKYLAEYSPTTCTVIVDNMAAQENVTRFLQSQHYSVTVQQQGKLWYLEATNNHTLSSVNAQENTPSPSLPLQREEEQILVIISSSVFGAGDDVLGANLIKNFINTLPEMGESLWRIILLNGGVHLSTPKSPVLHGLRTLEQAGVSILVCGACLEHFGLMQEKVVGQTTNMLDVVTSMQYATKVIKI